MYLVSGQGQARESLSDHGEPRPWRCWLPSNSSPWQVLQWCQVGFQGGLVMGSQAQLVHAGIRHLVYSLKKIQCGFVKQIREAG